MKLFEISEYNLFKGMKHLWRQGILSDYWYGYLTAHQENKIESKIHTTKKQTILRDMLLNSLRRKISFDPYTELTIFYNQNSRGDFHEIKRYKKMFDEFFKLEMVFDYGLKDLIESKYSQIRARLESMGDWSLYKVLIDGEFQGYIKLLEKNIEASILNDVFSRGGAN